VTWYEFHEFAIERTPSEIIYSIDGQEVARVATAFAGALPVGVWNDRWSLMLTDWVEVCQVELAQAVKVDIKPRSCPNPLNVESQGVVPVAILGSEDFDVNNIDGASVRLAGVAANRSSLEDSAAPASDGNECECTTDGPDGYTDLTLKFKMSQIAVELLNATGELVEGQELVLTLTGLLYDGTPIEGSDCVVLVGQVPEEVAASRADCNRDGTIDLSDLFLLKRHFGLSVLLDY
jgi:hypothetical protein